ncbi:MAG: PAS domain S-box protein [Ignavibacteria bacterium]|nr:PAS domain S-box protein [Ignavibacteria bacterium]
MEEALIEKIKQIPDRAELLFSRLWDISVDGMRLIDRNGNILMVNDAYCRIIGMTKDDLIGRPFSVVYHHSEKENVFHTYLIDTSHEEIKTRFERENILWNGKRCWFEFSNSFLDLPDSEKVTLSIIKDITERKNSELELIESEKKFRMLFNNANDAVFVTQLRENKTYGDFIIVNNIACQRFGYTKEEFLRLSPSAIVQPQYIEEFNRSIEKLIFDNHIIYQVIHRAKDNKLIPTEVSSHLFTYDGELTVLSIARDITERKEAEDKLRRNSIVLRNLASHLQSIREEERTLIAREIHDELGQVLTVLKIQITLLANKLRDDQKDLKEKINHLSQVIDDSVESVQRITSKLRPNILDELGLIAAIEWQTQEFKKTTGKLFSLSFSSNEVIIDKEKSTVMFRIFQEAVTNIIRHASADHVYIALNYNHPKLILEVRDNGLGISSEQIKNPRSLGIIGMKERALAVGGEVTIEGIPTKGTTVNVEIPFDNESK